MMVLGIINYSDLVHVYRVQLHTVPLNYNFIFTHVDICDNTQYFACKIPKFPVEYVHFNNVILLQARMANLADCRESKRNYMQS